MNQDQLNRGLLYAAESGDLAEMERLVQLGATVNDNYFGVSALNQACEGGHLEMVQALIMSHGAQVNYRALCGETALHSACSGGHLEVVECLIDSHKVSVDVTDDDELTPLHAACKSGQVAVVQCLLTKYGANLHAKDDQGRTPLKLTCESGKGGLRRKTDSVIEYLLQNHGEQLKEAEDCISLAESTLCSREGAKVMAKKYLKRERKDGSREESERKAWHENNNEFAGVKPLND